jgi:endonuclease/exonuclease/phosphatase family metal-dependent hydrolase
LVPEPIEGDLSTITVASYNIHRCVGSNGRPDAERIARVIHELDVQIIGLQEVESRKVAESHWFDILAHLPGFTAIVGPTIERSDGHYGNLLLTTHAAVDVQHVDLTVPGLEPRGAIDAHMQIQGRQVRVVVTHLGLKAGERRYQARKLIRCLGDDANNLTILLGDINEWFPLSPLLRRFHRYFGKSPTLFTFPSHRPWLALDRIWVRPPSALRQLSVHKSPFARIASDHLPLKAYIELL